MFWQHLFGARQVLHEVTSQRQSSLSKASWSKIKQAEVLCTILLAGLVGRD